MEQQVNGVRLFIGEDMERPQTVAMANGQACVFTQPRAGRTTANEDSVAVIPVEDDSGVLAVADGLGGLPSGSLASGIAMQELAACLADEPGRDLRDAVLSGMEAANAAVMERGQGGGTTLAAVSIVDSAVRAYWAGDSSILVCGQRGKLKYLSMAHSPVGYAQASGMLEEEDAMFHDDRHLVSNMVGTAAMHVEVGPLLELARRDTVVLGSDGLFDNLYVGEIIEQVRSGPLEKAASRLLQLCRERMSGIDAGQPHKPDDIAFILYRSNGVRPSG